MRSMDEQAFCEEVFDIIEPVLEKAGYQVLEGDADTAYIVAPDGDIHFEIKLRLANLQEIQSREGDFL